MKRFFTCYRLNPSPEESQPPDLDHPLPKPNWNRENKERQKALQRSLSNGYGSPTIVARDTTFLVNIACDRQNMGQAATWQPANYQPGPATFKRLSSTAARGAPPMHRERQWRVATCPFCYIKIINTMY